MRFPIDTHPGSARVSPVGNSQRPFRSGLNRKASGDFFSISIESRECDGSLPLLTQCAPSFTDRPPAPKGCPGAFVFRSIRQILGWPLSSPAWRAENLLAAPWRSPFWTYKGHASNRYVTIGNPPFPSRGGRSYSRQCDMPSGWNWRRPWGQKVAPYVWPKGQSPMPNLAAREHPPATSC